MLTRIGDDNVHLARFLLHQSSGSHIIFFAPRRDLDRYDNIGKFGGELSKWIVAL